MNLSAIHSAVSPGAAITGACVLTRQTMNICFYKLLVSDTSTLIENCEKQKKRKMIQWWNFNIFDKVSGLVCIYTLNILFERHHLVLAGS